MNHFQFALRGPPNVPLGTNRRITMTTVLAQVEDALCWTILAPVVRARRRRVERRVSQELHDRERIDRVLNEIVENHADLLC